MRAREPAAPAMMSRARGGRNSARGSWPSRRNTITAGPPRHSDTMAPVKAACVSAGGSGGRGAGWGGEGSGQGMRRAAAPAAASSAGCRMAGVQSSAAALQCGAMLWRCGRPAEQHAGSSTTHPRAARCPRRAHTRSRSADQWPQRRAAAGCGLLCGERQAGWAAAALPRRGSAGWERQQEDGVASAAHTCAGCPRQQGLLELPLPQMATHAARTS